MLVMNGMDITILIMNNLFRTLGLESCFIFPSQEKKYKKFRNDVCAFFCFIKNENC